MPLLKSAHCCELLLSILGLLTVSLTAHALPDGKVEVTNRALKAVKLSAPPVIDGDLSDSAWQSAAVSEGFTDTYDQAAMPDGTMVRLGYDAKNIYIAFDCRDSDPDGIIARQTRREGFLEQDDHVTFRINPFGTRTGQDESQFAVNPIGTQETEIAGGRAGKEEWRGAWQSAARRTRTGYAVEMSIPWEILTRPAGGKPADVDINFSRYHARIRRESFWSNIGENRRREFGGRWLGVAMPKTTAGRPLSVLGYNFSGKNGSNGTVVRSGLDARYQFNDQLSLVGTLNPDFDNIEGDVTSIEFSYSERLADERRPFFLEGRNYFGGGGGTGGLRIFTPQRIPRFNEGMKFFGKARPTSDVGVLTTIGSRRNDAVFQWRESLSPSSSVSLGYVRLDDAGISNDVWQVSSNGRSGDWQGGVSYSGSTDKTGPGEQLWANGGWFNNTTGFNVRLSQISPGYMARNGYIPFTNTKGMGAVAWHEYQWRTGPIRDLNFFGGAGESHRFDGSFFQRFRNINIGARTAGDIRVRASYSEEGFESFRDFVKSVSMRYPASDPFHSFGVDYSTGKRQGAKYRYLAPAFTYRFGERLTLRYSLENVSHTESLDLGIFTINYDIDKKQSVAGRMVKFNNKTNWYVSYRQSGYGGLEWFVILGDPNTEKFSERLVAKVVAPIF